MKAEAANAGTRLAAAAQACTLALDREFAEVLRRLGPAGQPDRAFQLLSQLTFEPGSGAELARISASIASDLSGDAVARTLLLLASQHAIARVPDLPVSETVKRLFADEFEFFADPPPLWAKHFQASDVRYVEMARLATLRRFPAGQFHWEISAFPRSWVAKASQPWRVVAHVIGRMGGFSPMFELHLNARRKNRLVLLEKEANISYYRAARAVEMQPAVRGLILSSWLFCESTAQLTPRLAWLRQTPLSGGALIASLGPALPDSGFMTGSDERRRLYEEGVYKPTLSCVLWPRKALIEWANHHPEFDT